MSADPYDARVLELADDVGRFRRRLESLSFLAEEIARHVEVLARWHEPTAAEIVELHAPGDDDAVAEALRLVDERHAQLRRRLGYRDEA